MYLFNKTSNYFKYKIFTSLLKKIILKKRFYKFIINNTFISFSKQYKLSFLIIFSRTVLIYV